MIEKERERVQEQMDKKALTTDFRISKGKQNNVHIKSILTVHTHTPAQANILGQGGKGIIYKKTHTNKSQTQRIKIRKANHKICCKLKTNKNCVLHV